MIGGDRGLYPLAVSMYMQDSGRISSAFYSGYPINPSYHISCYSLRFFMRDQEIPDLGGVHTKILVPYEKSDGGHPSTTKHLCGTYINPTPFPPL